jgi:hypothetical protein
MVEVDWPYYSLYNDIFISQQKSALRRFLALPIPEKNKQTLSD